MTESDATHTLDKTWQEIYDAFPNVQLVINDKKYAITAVGHGSTVYYVASTNEDSFDGYATDSSDGYPSYDDINNPIL